MERLRAALAAGLAGWVLTLPIGLQQVAVAVTQCDEPLTRRVSVSHDEAEGTRDSALPSISGDGRFVAFMSKAPNLVAGDDNHNLDVFVRDRLDGTTEIVSVSTSGEVGNAASLAPAISRNGRFVAFNSEASNFVPGDIDPGQEGSLEVFVHDRDTGVTERVAVDSNGNYVSAPSFAADVSASGRYVAFTAAAALAPGDENQTFDVYVRDRDAGTTDLVSAPASGPHLEMPSMFPAISGNGRYVTFDSSQPNLVPNDTNSWNDVFVVDRTADTVERVSVDRDGGQGRRGSTEPEISRDGRFVVFMSEAPDLVWRDSNGPVGDVFLHDRQTGLTTLVSRSTKGRQSPEVSGGPSVSDDGTRIAFISPGGKLAAGDTNDAWDVFVRDRDAHVTERVSVGPGGRQALGNDEPFWAAAISGDGASVAFESTAGNLVPHDDNGRADVFVFGRPPACGAGA
jgi:Tol biopolymer transport system component